MSTTRETRFRGAAAGLAALALSLGIVAVGGQGVTPGQERADHVAAGFKEFSERVQAYLELQQTVETSLPALQSTELPEMISAFQQALARKIREARLDAKPGDLFTPAACEAFRQASRVALGVQGSATSRAYMEPEAADPGMALTVNGLYPDTEPITALSPTLLAAYPTLPAEVAYRVVGRALILIDVKSSLVIDVARLILPPLSQE